MKGSFKFVGLQLEVCADKAKNISSAVEKIKEVSKTHDIQMIALPEMFVCPYSTSVFADYSEPINGGPTTKALSEAAKQSNCYIIGGSFPEKSTENPNQLFNTCVCFNPQGEIIAVHRKIHLFKISAAGKIVFDESTVLTPGNNSTYFETPWGKIGIGICFDLRFPEYARHLVIDHGVSMVVYPGAFNMLTGPAHWELLLRARAVDNQCFIAGIAPARDEKSPYYVSYGHSMVVSPWGEIVGGVQSQNGDLPESFIVEINQSKQSAAKATIPVIECRRTDLYSLTWKEPSSNH